MYDGHNSRFSVELIDSAIEHNIILFALPPHTTHRLQPCDVGAFSPLKRAWTSRCETILSETGQPMCVQDVVQEYMKAREISFKEETIVQAFRKSGIRVDADGILEASIDVFSDSDFAPSIVTSTRLHMPEGFPEDHRDILDDETIAEPEYVSSDEGFDDEDNSDMSSDDEWNGDDININTEDRDIDYSPPAPAPLEQPNSGQHVSSRLRCEVQGTLGPSTAQWATTHPLIAHYQEPFDDHKDCEPPADWDDKQKIQFYQQKIAQIKRREVELRDQRDVATAHAVLSGRENHGLKQQINTKKSSKGRHVVVEAQIISTQGGWEQAAKQRKARDDKDVKAQEVQARKRDAEYERQHRRESEGREGMIFAGSLNSQRRGTLDNIAWSLGISETGTKEVLLARINTYFTENVSLQDDRRYVALFGSKRG